ncbi:MAG: DNA polymerase III subunit beta [Chloroflexi bacterium]|nr:DNA polymerase III subunit beta [Chloroflexota bacterium]MYK61869.1 DNA polymerase III subunit beta [Chloroflexota bacterium]
MKITCIQENLARGLRVVNRAVPSRATLPITQNILIEAEDARVKLSATDLELSITTWVGAQIEATGAITLPARTLIDTISSFDMGRVELEVTDEPYGAHIQTTTQSGSGPATIDTDLRGAPKDDFPPFPEVSPKHRVRVDSGILRNALDRTVFAAATDDARPVLTGVKMEVEGDKATFAAADGFRLSIESAQLMDAAEEGFDALIPARALRELTALMSGTVSPVEIMVSETGGEAMFRIGDDIEMITQLIAGTYPDYKSLVPENSDTTMTIPLEGVAQVARSMNVIAREGSAIVRLVGSDLEGQGRLTLSANAEDLGNSEGSLDIDIEGEEGKIAFNVRFLTDLVQHSQGGSSNPVETDGDGTPGAEKLVLSITTPSSPAVFRHSSHPGFTHVVMPMYVQW